MPGFIASRKQKICRMNGMKKTIEEDHFLSYFFLFALVYITHITASTFITSRRHTPTRLCTRCEIITTKAKKITNQVMYFYRSSQDTNLTLIARTISLLTISFPGNVIFRTVQSCEWVSERLVLPICKKCVMRVLSNLFHSHSQPIFKHQLNIQYNKQFSNENHKKATKLKRTRKIEWKKENETSQQIYLYIIKGKR